VEHLERPRSVFYLALNLERLNIERLLSQRCTAF
jgi:hypothetical protein